jgi:hypothetical protein
VLGGAPLTVADQRQDVPLRRNIARLREAKPGPHRQPGIQDSGRLDPDTAGQPPCRRPRRPARITSRCHELATVRALVREFAVMLCNRTGRKLPGWADRAEASSIPSADAAGCAGCQPGASNNTLAGGVR